MSCAIPVIVRGSMVKEYGRHPAFPRRPHRCDDPPPSTSTAVAENPLPTSAGISNCPTRHRSSSLLRLLLLLLRLRLLLRHHLRGELRGELRGKPDAVSVNHRAHRHAQVQHLHLPMRQHGTP